MWRNHFIDTRANDIMVQPGLLKIPDGGNFFNFVNRYRVDEVKQKILNPKYDNYSVLGIALECGFNSKTAFNRIFKHMTGLTPTEYKKTHNFSTFSVEK